MLDGVKDKCGIVVCHSAHDTYKALKAIQHRGQDSAGISAKHGRGIDTLRWEGLVDGFSLEAVHELLDGDIFMGHVRYSTTVGDDQDALFDGAHPRFTGGSVTSYKGLPNAHLIARNSDDAIGHNGNIPFLRRNPGEIDTDVMMRAFKKHGIKWVMENMPAAYAAGIMERGANEVVVFRDRHGIKPLWIGEKDGKVVAASEDIAIWDIGGKPIREVHPGEAVYIKHDGSDFRAVQVVEPSIPSTLCFFEVNYNSALSSSIGGKTINDMCMRLGYALAEEYQPDVDVVTDFPNRPLSMARGYAEARGLPFRRLFYKAKKIRAFLGPDEATRKEMIGANLFVRDVIMDDSGMITQEIPKRVIVVDDSLVRFNNGPDGAKKLKDRGAKYVALAVCTPQIGAVIGGEPRGCLYGVDMPPDDDFAVRRYKDIREMAAASGFDDIHYLSTEGMFKAHRVPQNHRCAYCIGGCNPLSEEEIERLKTLEI